MKKWAQTRAKLSFMAVGCVLINDSVLRTVPKVVELHEFHLLIGKKEEEYKSVMYCVVAGKKE